MQCALIISKPFPSAPHLGPWENCLPYNQSLVPKRMGITVLNQSHIPVFEKTVYILTYGFNFSNYAMTYCLFVIG